MIFSKFEKMVAGRYLRAKRKEGFISVITTFAFIGIALGVAFGIIFDNLGLWLPIGVCIGLVGPAMKSMKKNNKDNNTNEPDKE